MGTRAGGRGLGASGQLSVLMVLVAAALLGMVWGATPASAADIFVENL